jgi:hypothetical protein
MTNFKQIQKAAADDDLGVYLQLRHEDRLSFYRQALTGARRTVLRAIENVERLERVEPLTCGAIAALQQVLCEHGARLDENGGFHLEFRGYSLIVKNIEPSPFNDIDRALPGLREAVKTLEGKTS